MTHASTHGASTLGAPRAEAGFTLVEVVIAIVLVGIMSAIALPKLNLRSYQMNSAAPGAMATLGYAQRLAISLQTDVRVAIDVPNRRFRVHEDGNNDGELDAGERVTYATLDDGVVFGRGTAAPLASIGPDDVSFLRRQDGLPVITFRRDGSASEAGGFYLNHATSLAQGRTTETRAVELTRSTGRVAWYAPSDSSWTRRN